MSKSPLTVYLEGEVLAALEQRATALGMTRSGWAAQAVERALNGGMSSYDTLMLEQTVRCRALLEVLIDAPKNPDERKAQRERGDARHAKFLTAAMDRIGR